MNINWALWSILASDLEIRDMIPCVFSLVIKEVLVKTIITVFFSDVGAKIKLFPVNFSDVTKPMQW